MNTKKGKKAGKAEGQEMYVNILREQRGGRIEERIEQW